MTTLITVGANIHIPLPFLEPRNQLGKLPDTIWSTPYHLSRRSLHQEYQNFNKQERVCKRKLLLIKMRPLKESTFPVSLSASQQRRRWQASIDKMKESGSFSDILQFLLSLAGEDHRI